MRSKELSNFSETEIQKIERICSSFERMFNAEASKTLTITLLLSISPAYNRKVSPFVKGIKGPQPWTSIMPTGGVSPTEENLKGWFDAGVTCVGMGSQLISKEIISTKDFKTLTKNVQNALNIIRNVRNK